MKTVFVGGGRGCRAVLELVSQGRLSTLDLEVLGVVDPDETAPGVVYARQQGWNSWPEFVPALAVPGLELLIELTGIDAVLHEVHRRAPSGVRVMDHVMARVFWDLDATEQRLRDELARQAELEAALRQEQEDLQQLLDSLPDAVMVVDEEGRIVRVNRRFERQTAQSLAQVAGRSCHEVACRASCDPERAGTPCPRLEVLKSDAPLTVVHRDGCLGRHAGDEERHFEITAHAVRLREGQRVVITSRDVTDRILLERETEESARRFRQLVDRVQSLITIKDLSGRYQLVNPAASRFFDIPEGGFTGRTAGELLPSAVAAVIEGHDQLAVAERRNLRHDETLRIDGADRYLVSERFLLVDYQDQPLGLCTVSQDVTEARRLQNELIHSEKLVAVGKLAAGVAHEINNPLTGVLAFAEDLLEETPAHEPAHEDLQVIVRETLRCRRIVRDLLDFSRQSEPVRERLSLAAVAQRAVELVRKQATFRDIELRVLTEGDTPLYVDADANQLQQVLLNLIINARDALDGRGRIDVVLRRDEASGRVQLAVVDEGPGIADDRLELIFEPFFSTKGEQGNGLGLPAVRSIVDQHHGTIAVRSAVGQGSTFEISLPAAQ